MRGILAAVAMLAMAGSALAKTTTINVTPTSGTCTMQAVDLSVGASILGSDNMWMLRTTWVSTSGGDVAVMLPNIMGKILDVMTVPDSGATSPTANYDVTLLYRSKDVLAGRGMNRSATLPESFTPLVGDGGTTGSLRVITGPVQLRISGAGAANGGTVEIAIQR